MLPIGNDIDVKIDGLHRSADGSYIEDALLLATMTDAAGEVVAGAEDIALPFVTGSNGNYRGVLPGSIVLVDGEKYTTEVRATNYNFRTQLIDRAGRRGDA